MSCLWAINIKMKNSLIAARHNENEVVSNINSRVSGLPWFWRIASWWRCCHESLLIINVSGFNRLVNYKKGSQDLFAAGLAEERSTLSLIDVSTGPGELAADIIERRRGRWIGKRKYRIHPSSVTANKGSATEHFGAYFLKLCLCYVPCWILISIFLCENRSYQVSTSTSHVSNP